MTKFPSPHPTLSKARSRAGQKGSLTCTTSLTRVLSVPVLALCRPLTLSPIQVMRANLTRLLMASPVVNRTNPNNLISSLKTKKRKKEKSLDGRQKYDLTKECLGNSDQETTWLCSESTNTYKNRNAIRTEEMCACTHTKIFFPY